MSPVIRLMYNKCVYFQVSCTISDCVYIHVYKAFEFFPNDSLITFYIFSNTSDKLHISYSP